MTDFEKIFYSAKNDKKVTKSKKVKEPKKKKKQLVFEQAIKENGQSIFDFL